MSKDRFSCLIENSDEKYEKRNNNSDVSNNIFLKSNGRTKDSESRFEYTSFNSGRDRQNSFKTPKQENSNKRYYGREDINKFSGRYYNKKEKEKEKEKKYEYNEEDFPKL